MHSQLAALLASLLASIILLACDPCPDADDGTGSTDTDTTGIAGTGTDTGEPEEPYCCNCPSGECWGEPDKAACGALTAATGEQHSWCEGTVEECLAECKATTICCQCKPAPPSCQVWPWGEAQCLASAGATALWCEDASPESCGLLCG